VTTPPGDLGGATIAIVNWRDPWHPLAGGAERYAWEMARGLAARRATVLFLTARAPGQARREYRDRIEIVRLGGRFTVYPLVLGWLLLHRLTRRRRCDAVLDCQNGIPFFTPCVLPRRVPVFCVVHHVHTSQFGLHFPPWLARAGRLLEGPASRLVYRRHICVAVSPSTVTAMRIRLRWKGDIQIIPNGTVVPAVRPVPPDADAAGPAGPVRLVWVGRLVAHKRPGLILPVAQRLGETAVIDVIGRGPEGPALAAAIDGGGPAARLSPRLRPGRDRRAIGPAPEHVPGRGLGAVRARSGRPRRAHRRLRRRRAARRRPRRSNWLAGQGRRADRGRRRARAEGAGRPGPPCGGRVGLPRLGAAVQLGHQRRADGRADPGRA
jgi:glycosyltransferase involved in cell wall biosynthesis